MGRSAKPFHSSVYAPFPPREHPASGAYTPKCKPPPPPARFDNTHHFSLTLRRSQHLQYPEYSDYCRSAAMVYSNNTLDAFAHPPAVKLHPPTKGRQASGKLDPLCRDTIENRKSPIENRQSRIPNRQSKIENRQSSPSPLWPCIPGLQVRTKRLRQAHHSAHHLLLEARNSEGRNSNEGPISALLPDSATIKCGVPGIAVGVIWPCPLECTESSPSDRLLPARVEERSGCQ